MRARACSTRLRTRGFRGTGARWSLPSSSENTYVEPPSEETQRMSLSSDTHFDVVIVGSGFGGSVMAYRLAEAGLRVCVLERGKAYPPGSFPRTPAGFAANFWDPSEGLYGMYDVWSFRGVESVVSS